MAAAVPVAPLPFPLQEKDLSSPSTPSRNSNERRDVEAAVAPRVQDEHTQPIRPIHGWRWALGGMLYDHYTDNQLADYPLG